MIEKRKVLEQYYADNYDNLVRGWSRKAGSPENAEDLVQEAFTKALQYLYRYDLSQPFEGWLITILNNCWRDQSRQERMQGMSMTLEDADEMGLIEAIEIKDDNHKVVRIIKKMIANSRSAARDILYLRFGKQCKPSEIGHYLNIEVHTVSTAIYRFKNGVAESFRNLLEA